MSTKPFAGVEVVEVAGWTFVPAAGAILADLGADVIKVEPPSGDPQRGLRNMLNQADDTPNPFLEIPNRGKRSITLDLGKPGASEVLLNTGMWAMAPDIAAAPFTGEVPRGSREAPANPIANLYRTKDGRWINLVCLQADRFWDELCALIDRVDLVLDERFTSMASRTVHNRECVAELDKTFGERPLDEWKEVLSGFSGVWAPALTPAEVHEHVAVIENDYLSHLKTAEGTAFQVVAPPYQFDEQPTDSPSRAPELGQHTAEVLTEAGIDEEAQAAYRAAGVLG